MSLAQSTIISYLNYCGSFANGLPASAFAPPTVLSMRRPQWSFLFPSSEFFCDFWFHSEWKASVRVCKALHDLSSISFSLWPHLFLLSGQATPPLPQRWSSCSSAEMQDWFQFCTCCALGLGHSSPSYPFKSLLIYTFSKKLSLTSLSFFFFEEHYD